MSIFLVRWPGRPSCRAAFSLLALLSAIAFAETVAGQDAAAQDLSDEIDKILSWVTLSDPGFAVAVAQDGELLVHRAYGLANVEDEVPLTPDTVFDVGSVTKQFVAAAVLLLVEEEEVSLGDDVAEYFPELPEYDHIITVDHLLTHTSGVRDWLGLPRLSSEDEEALTMVLRQRGLNFVPGDEWSYSSSNYVLLKELVARVTEMSFSEFAHRRLFEPLGMDATTYADDLLEEHENLAVAYERRGNNWKKEVLVGNERGGGGALLSTVGDLIIWNEALDTERLGADVTKKLQEPARLNNGRELGYARGLSLTNARGYRVVWHSGSAGAYKAMLSRYPEHGLSIAILSNAGDSADRASLVRRICDLMLPTTYAPPDATDGPVENAVAKGIDLESKTGLFFSERAGEPLRLIAQSDTLRIVGGPALAPIANDRFRNPEPSLNFMSEDKFDLQFLSSDEFDLESMEGETTRYRRAQPFASTAAKLQEFVGRYECEDLKAVFEVEVGSDDLLIRLGPQELKFAPVDRDTFQFSRIMVRFRRDADGKVVALDLSNPLLRDVPFPRQ